VVHVAEPVDERAAGPATRGRFLDSNDEKVVFIVGGSGERLYESAER
jgi:hypothetical protein